MENNFENLIKDKFAAHYVIYNYDTFLNESLESVIPNVDKVLIAKTTKPWSGSELDLTETNQIISKIKLKYGDKVEVYEDEFESEEKQRNFLIQKSQSENYKGAFIVDCDEIFLERTFKKFYELISSNNPDAIRAPYLTFIKDASFVVSEPYETGLFYVNLQAKPVFEWARMVNLEETNVECEQPTIAHFSYLRKNDSDILSKVQNFMHSKDADWNEWYNKIYVKFNPDLKNFHPVTPETWRALKEFDVNNFPDSLISKLRGINGMFYSERVRENSNLKLHLGCGPIVLEDYINIDLYSAKADLKLDITDLKYFRDNSVSEIFMNAVFEHIYDYEQIPALLEWKRILKPGGKLIINSIPDFDEIADAYVNKKHGNCSEIFSLYEVTRYTHGAYNRSNYLGQIHKDLFTKDKVEKLLTEAGLEIESLKNVHWEDEPIPCNINLIAKKPEKADSEGTLEEAEKFIEEGKYFEAEQMLKSLLTKNEFNIDAMNDLAVSKILQNKYEESLEILERIFKLDPQNEIAQENLNYLSNIK